jgi:hypothetical protein
VGSNGGQFSQQKPTQNSIFPNSSQIPQNNKINNESIINISSANATANPTPYCSQQKQAL